MRLRKVIFAAVLAFVAITALPASAAPSPVAATGDGGMTPVAGTGEAGPSRDGIPGVEALLNRPTGIAVAPEGTIYISDSGNHRVRAIDADGIIRTVAGTGEDSPDAPAPASGVKGTEVPLASPGDLAVGPDGTLFIADGRTTRVYALAPDGTISVRADGDTGKGVPAGPIGVLSGLAAAADGTIYVADRENVRVLALAPDGSVRAATETPTGPVTGLTVDSNGDVWMTSAMTLHRLSGTTLTRIVNADEGTWQAAETTGTSLFSDVTAVSAGRDGVYVINRDEHAVRRLAPDGAVTTVATFAESQKPILWAAAAMAPDGPIYVVDNAANRVYAVPVTKAGRNDPPPEPDRTGRYLAGALVLVLLGVIALWGTRRSRRP